MTSTHVSPRAIRGTDGWELGELVGPLCLSMISQKRDGRIGRTPSTPWSPGQQGRADDIAVTGDPTDIRRTEVDVLLPGTGTFIQEGIPRTPCSPLQVWTTPLGLPVDPRG